ncbi:hypothetical protein NUW54_g1165 [Trametes sanguinea]|uniref:Uncharacterized protein n=1 Tax=Trametes sanguinea TaxID=158606 RepID=A0ACC1Q7C3_9APHY|nr:hypothetical protein NUW54_g1165 [Trametes sanguinea]
MIGLGMGADVPMAIVGSRALANVRRRTDKLLTSRSSILVKFVCYLSTMSARKTPLSYGESQSVTTPELEKWLQSRDRFRCTADAIVHYSIIWAMSRHNLQGDKLPESILDNVYEGHQDHIDAAHEWLRDTLNLMEKADHDDQEGILPIRITPTPERAVVMSLALDKNYAYFCLLEKTVQMLLAYLAQERKLLLEWCTEHATRITSQATPLSPSARFSTVSYN